MTELEWGTSVLVVWAHAALLTAIGMLIHWLLTRRRRRGQAPTRTDHPATRP